MPAKKKVAITVRLEPKLARRVKKLAKDAGRSASSMIEWTLEDRIDDEEKIMKRLLEGMEQARKGQGMELHEAISDLKAQHGGGRRARKTG